LGSLRGDLLNVEFNRSLLTIKRKVHIPDLRGSVDIYPTDQSAVLVTNNKWNPRPVFQSYSAYTPALAGLNEAHLRGDAAPDNILFSIDPIDGRLPSLEDGMSWPALFDNYALTGIDNGIVYLRRNPRFVRTSSKFTMIDEGVRNTGETVAIPGSSVPIFAEIDLSPTVAGKFWGTIFKYPELKIIVTLENGASKEYRVVAEMMRSGFFLSPLVESTEDFKTLLTQDPGYLRRNAVQSIVVAPVSGAGTLWQGTYTLRLKAYDGTTGAAR
jgi:hypothetical protein